MAAREYTGVADYDEYRDAPAGSLRRLRRPGRGRAHRRPVRGVPALPRACSTRRRSRSRPPGLDVPWYISRGNHDGLVQGNAPASTDLFRAIAVGCLKVFPNAEFNPADYAGKSADELFASFGDPAFIQKLIAGGKTVAPDPDRRIISKVEYRKLIGNTKKHGFGYTPSPS